MREGCGEIYKMPLPKFRPEAIIGVASPYYWASVGERGNFKEFPTHTQDHGDA